MDIKYKNETKFLGLYLIENVKWDVHIICVCNILIHSLKNITSINTLRSIYFANFYLHLRYGILFWGGDSPSTKAFNCKRRL